MSLNKTQPTTTLLSTRRPRLVRIWRSAGPGCPLTSIWIPAVPQTPRDGLVQ